MNKTQRMSGEHDSSLQYELESLIQLTENKLWIKTVLTYKKRPLLNLDVPSNKCY